MSEELLEDKEVEERNDTQVARDEDELKTMAEDDEYLSEEDLSEEDIGDGDEAYEEEVTQAEVFANNDKKAQVMYALDMLRKLEAVKEPTSGRNDMQGILDNGKRQRSG